MKSILRGVLDFFIKRWQAKIGSLVTALLLSWYVHDSRNAIRVIQVRVEKPTVPERLVIASRIPSFLNVQVRGPKEQINFPANDLRIVLTNPARPDVGETLYQARLSTELPPGMTAEYRGEIPVTLDREALRELPIVPMLEVKSEILTPGNVQLDRTTVLVQGPAKSLAEMDRVHTQTMIIDGSSERIVSRKLLLGDLAEFVQVAPGQRLDVNVTVRLRGREPEEGEIVVHKVPVRCLNEVNGVLFKVEGETVDVIVSGDKGVTQADLTARIFCPALIAIIDGKGKITSPLRVRQLPVRVEDRFHRPNVQVTGVVPPRVNLILEQGQWKAPEELRQGFEEHFIPK